MPALTVGITTARNPACKRGIAVNLAASLARDPQQSRRVCVVDADPLNLDVTTRLAVRGPVLEDFARPSVPASSALGSVHEPPLWVLPSAGAGVDVTRRAANRALHQLRQDFDVVICDVFGGPSGQTPIGSGGLDRLDWLLVAVTPQEDAVADAAEFVAHLQAEAEHGAIAAAVGLGVVLTGDEGTVGGEGTGELTADAISARLAAPVMGSVRQLWGRSVPNLGFGAALGIDDLDDAVGSLFSRLDQNFADLGAR